MSRPEKYTIREFYIIPAATWIRAQYDNIKEWCIIRVGRRWWCDYCERWHGCRVKKYSLVVSLTQPATTVCSLALQDRPDLSRILSNTVVDLNARIAKMVQMLPGAAQAAYSASRALCTMGEEMRSDESAGRSKP